MKSQKAPKKTAEQVSVERRQQFMLDEEIEETEGRLKAVARGKLGKASLLTSGATRRGGATGGSSLIGGASSGGTSGSGGNAPRTFTGGSSNQK